MDCHQTVTNRFKGEFVKAKYTLYKRGKVYYYRLGSDLDRRQRSTGKKTKTDAALYVEHEVIGFTDAGRGTLGEYAADFFKWTGEIPECPHCSRVLASGGQIGKPHAKHQRRLLERFILGDAKNKPDIISTLKLGQIKRGDCIEFRDRVIRKIEAKVTDREDSKGKRVVNSALVVLSTIFSEAMEREHVESNPASRLAIRFKGKQRGVFDAGELRKLFPAAVNDLGPWPSFRVKCAFLIAGTCGLRRNEIRALRWPSVDFERGALHVVEAFKDQGSANVGLPKWDKRRVTALPGVAARHLLALKASAKPEHFVFGRRDVPLGTKHWKESWADAMEALEFDAERRNLVPHSLRHSIATQLRAKGISDVLLKSGLGWSSDAMLEHYSDHMDVDALKGQAGAVDELLG